jgi:large exoprotein involved in heme utilization and adhesion
VTINATDSISMSGETGGQFPEPLFSLGTIQPSGIFTLTIGGQCAGPCGNAGNISINTGSLSMGTGSQINSGTSSSGLGGNITINAANTIAMSGTLSTGQPGGIQSRSIGADQDAGAGGDITLTAGQSVTLSNGAAVSASSMGPGSTGNIQINAGNQFAMTNSTVTTEANHSSGGAIKITTNPNGTVQLTDSMISASVLDGTGGGGSVSIDPQFVLLQNSQILANAVFGPGGNIFITTNLLLPDASSVISASSQFGQNGTITIQSPNAPASGKIQPLGKSPLLPTSLLTQRCAALAGGEISSFTVAGRDSLPAEPGGWLSSPLALAISNSGGGTLTEASTHASVGEPVAETPLLSLRRIAPPGFLTQAFAVDWSGCTS